MLDFSEPNYRCVAPPLTKIDLFQRSDQPSLAPQINDSSTQGRDTIVAQGIMRQCDTLDKGLI